MVVLPAVEAAAFRTLRLVEGDDYLGIFECSKLGAVNQSRSARQPMSGYVWLQRVLDKSFLCVQRLEG